MRLLARYLETPRPCAYLPVATAQLETFVLDDVSPEELDDLLIRGYRRFGPIYFRPACTGCLECVSLRVPVASYARSKSQRRAANGAAPLRRVVGVPRTDDARLALYERWHAWREKARGWEANPVDEEGYGIHFAWPHPCAREAAFYHGDRLVGVGLWDVTARSSSAVFFYFEPDYAPLSLGVANVVFGIADAAAAGLEHVYLGYCVKGCASLEYKSRFLPHELLVGRPALDEAPRWVKIS